VAQEILVDEAELQRQKNIRARNIHMLMFERGWNQQDLSDASGVPPSTVSRLKRGIGDVGEEAVRRVAMALGVTVGRLYADSDTPGKVNRSRLPHGAVARSAA
jgi:transcriptional regulator with XRE-family HTH domain